MKGPRLAELSERAPASMDDCGEVAAVLRDWLDGLQDRLDGHPSQPDRTAAIMAQPDTYDPDTQH